MWLISQMWTYDGIRFDVGRPEQVATHPDYRRRGLVRALFEAFHQRSSRWRAIQAITGIEYFYRQFGYEYALDLGGNRSVLFVDIPNLKDGETEAYRFAPPLSTTYRCSWSCTSATASEAWYRPTSRSVLALDQRWSKPRSGDGWHPLLIEDTGSAGVRIRAASFAALGFSARYPQRRPG